MEIQKKWFIYLNDHHEGPFSVDEVRQKLITRTINKENYVWCEGMADWQMLSQAHELNQLEVSPSAEAAPAEASAPKKSQPRAATPGDASKSSRGKSITKMAGIAIGTLVLLMVLSVGGLAALSRSGSDGMHDRLRPTLIKMVLRFPILSSAFKLVPNFSDVKPDDQREMEVALMIPPEYGAKLEIELSQNDPNRPFFYVSTNLPSHIKLDYYLVGNSETLLNRLQYSTQGSFTVFEGIGKTEVLLAEGGQPLPKGEYKVYIAENLTQEESVTHALATYPPTKSPTKIPAQIPNGTKFIFSKVFFLGGARDETYLTRLKAFHEKVKTNAEKELLELKQYSDTLQLQFTTLTSEFGKIYRNKKPNNTQKNAWKKAADTWQQINGQLDQTIQTWSKDTLQNEYFYGKAFELVKSCFESLKTLFSLESNYLEHPQDQASFEIQQGKALSEAREATELLRSKVELLLNAPKTPSGLPTREGL